MHLSVVLHSSLLWDENGVSREFSESLTLGEVIRSCLVSQVTNSSDDGGNDVPSRNEFLFPENGHGPKLLCFFRNSGKTDYSNPLDLSWTLKTINQKWIESGYPGAYPVMKFELGTVYTYCRLLSFL